MTLQTVRVAPDIVIHTLRSTLLSDSGYALIGYGYYARIMCYDDCRLQKPHLRVANNIVMSQIKVNVS
jgi:hypothetical protein